MCTLLFELSTTDSELGIRKTWCLLSKRGTQTLAGRFKLSCDNSAYSWVAAFERTTYDKSQLKDHCKVYKVHVDTQYTSSKVTNMPARCVLLYSGGEGLWFLTLALLLVGGFAGVNGYCSLRGSFAFFAGDNGLFYSGCNTFNFRGQIIRGQIIFSGSLSAITFPSYSLLGDNLTLTRSALQMYCHHKHDA